MPTLAEIERSERERPSGTEADTDTEPGAGPEWSAHFSHAPPGNNGHDTTAARSRMIRCGHAQDQDHSGPVSVRQSKLRGQTYFYGALSRWPPLPTQIQHGPDDGGSS